MQCFLPSSAKTFDYSSELLIGCCHLLPEMVTDWMKVLLNHFQSQVQHRPSSDCQCLHCDASAVVLSSGIPQHSMSYFHRVMCSLDVLLYTLWWISSKSSCLRTVFFSNLFCFSLPWNDAVKSTFSDHKEQCINANTNTSVSVGHSEEFKRLQENTWA